MTNDDILVMAEASYKVTVTQQEPSPLFPHSEWCDFLSNAPVAAQVWIDEAGASLDVLIARGWRKCAPVCHEFRKGNHARE